MHDNCFTITSTKVGFMADGFSHLTRVSYDTLAANMLDMQYVWQHIIRLLVKIFDNSYETHSAVKRPNAVLCKRMRSATDKSKINSGCMQKHTREKAALFLQRYRVRGGRFVK